MIRKGICSIIGAIAIGAIVISTAKVSASSAWKTYESTYEMKGGVYTQKAFDVTKKIRICAYPTVGTSDCDMDIYKWEDTWFGCEVTDRINTVSSVSSSISYCYDSGNYGIYFRNWSGQNWTGKISIIYK